MKKILFPILFLSLFASAQAPRGFSITAGPTFSSFKSDDLLADSGVGFRTGLLFNFGYHENYNYQIETMWNQTTLKMLTVDQNYESAGTTNLKINTIDVGLFFNFYVLKPDEDKFYCGPQAGLNVGFKAGAESSGGDQAYYLPHRIQDLELDNLPNVYISPGVGLTGGYNDFRFDLRYTMGLANVLKDVQTDSYDENNNYTGPSLEGKLSFISLTISYRLAKMFGSE